MGELTVILMSACFVASIVAAALKRFDIAAALAIIAFILSTAELQNLMYERGELMERLSETVTVTLIYKTTTTNILNQTETITTTVISTSKTFSTEDPRWLSLQSRERSTPLFQAVSAFLTALFFILAVVQKALLMQREEY